MSRKPKGYVGTEHETIGSDIQAVVRALRNPDDILGRDVVRELEGLDPNGWYPIGRFLDLLEQIDARIGRFGLIKVGRTLFQMSHAANVKGVVRSAREFLYSMDAIYHHANRGRAIGGWKVIAFEPGRAELEKTTPHHCAMEEGIVAEGLATIGVVSLVDQEACFRSGAEACRFVVTSAIRDARWTG